MKHDIVFMYRLSDDDGAGLTRKEIVIRCDQPDPVEIVEAFQEFCVCMGLEVDAGTLPDDEDDLSVH
jgi:hypothetical protein